MLLDLKFTNELITPLASRWTREGGSEGAAVSALDVYTNEAIVIC